MSFKDADSDGSTRLDANLSVKGSEPSIIRAELVIVGTLRTTGEIHIEGKVVGDVHSARLSIGSGAFLEGDVFAEHAVVRGILVGNVRARKVFIGASGRVDGNLLLENLAIERGGHFEGDCRRVEKLDHLQTE